MSPLAARAVFVTLIMKIYRQLRFVALVHPHFGHGYNIDVNLNQPSSWHRESNWLMHCAAKTLQDEGTHLAVTKEAKKIALYRGEGEQHRAGSMAQMIREASSRPPIIFALFNTETGFRFPIFRLFWLQLPAVPVSHRLRSVDGDCDNNWENVFGKNFFTRIVLGQRNYSNGIDIGS